MKRSICVLAMMAGGGSLLHMKPYGYFPNLRRMFCNARVIEPFPTSTPPHFQMQWNEIKGMVDRLGTPPPITSMGAEALAYRNANSSGGSEFRFQTLIATMLSPQTKDLQTATAFQNLCNLVAPAPLSASELAKCDLQEVIDAINMVSFYKVKAGNVLSAAELCLTRYNGDIPELIEDLLQFKGVGPKIGFLTFTIARGLTLGICVDTHVHRISNRLGWVNTTTPEKTRIALEKWMPRELWGEVNERLVGFGQSICDARVPTCRTCKLKDYCLKFNGVPPYPHRG